MNKLIKTFSFSSLQCIYTFYLVSLCVMFYRLNSYTHTDYSSITTSKVYLFSWIPTNFNIASFLSFACPILMSVFLFLFFLLAFSWARWLWAVLFYLVEGFIFSYTLGHQIHMYIWIHLFFALIPGRMDSSKNEQFYLPFMRAAQLQIFLIYGLAGVWKFLALIESFSDKNIVAGADYIPYAISWEYINSNRLYEASWWIMQQPTLCFLLSAMVIIVQSGSALIAFFPRFYFAWGLLLALFHIGTLISINVFFRWSIPPILIFLCLYRNDSKSK